MYGFILSFILPNAIAVIFGGLLSAYLTRVYLPIVIFKALNTPSVFYVFDPVMLWFLGENIVIEKYILYIVTLVYLILVVIIEYFLTIKIVSKKGIYQ